jgi:hypothetical protein
VGRDLFDEAGIAPTTAAVPADAPAGPRDLFAEAGVSPEQMTGAMRKPAIFGSGFAKGLSDFVGTALGGAAAAGASEAGADSPQQYVAPVAASVASGADAAGLTNRPDLIPQSRAEKTIAAAGQGAGGALPYSLVGGLPGAAWGLLTGAAGGAAGDVAADALPSHPDLARLGGNLAGGFGIFGALKGLKYISTPAVEALERQFLPGAVERQAADRATHAISSDTAGGGPGPSQIADAMTAASGKPFMVADAAGENTQALLGRLYRTPGAQRQLIKETLEARDAGAGERITSDVERALTGGKWSNPDDIIASQKAAAAPAYEKAFANPAWSPRLQTFLDDPVMKQGLNHGMKMERLEAVAEGRPFDPTSMGVDLDALGNVTTLRTPNMRVLDAGKRGLDAMIAQETDQLTGKMSPMGRSLSIFRDRYVKQLDELNPDYAPARAAFSGPAQSAGAVRAGAASLDLTPTEAYAQLSKLAPNDQALFRQGAMDAYAKRIADTGKSGNETLGVARNATQEQRLLALAKDNDSYVEAMKALAQEKKMFDTKNATIGGSQTQARAVEDGGKQGDHGGGGIVALAGSSFLHGEPLTGAGLFAMRYASQLLNRNRTSMAPAVNEATARLLLSQDPAIIGGLRAPVPAPALTRPTATVPAGLIEALGTRRNQ